MRKLTFLSFTIALAFSFCLFSGILSASDITGVLPLSNKIINVHFDDGSVSYPDGLTVVRLNVTDASNPSLWTITSTDDSEFQTAQHPIDIGRKSMGTEFKKNPGSNWTDGFDPTGKPWASEHDIYLVLSKNLKLGKTYTISSSNLAANGTEWTFTYNPDIQRSEAIHVNTVGYAADAPKFGYIYQWMGDLGGLSLTEYASGKFRIYQEGNPVPVMEGPIRKRKSATNAETGQTNDTPNQNFIGGEVYDCDFSALTSDGTYYLTVDNIGRSYPFKIGTDAVFDAYYNVMRGLYHQRAGIRLAPPYTEADYIRPVNQNTKVTSDDGTSFAGKLLYSDYPYTSWAEGDGGGASQAAIRDAAIGKPLDVAGWYHDAGDWDQYYTHERIPIILMLTYEMAPERFSDADLNIPESGNGIPDIIDEASWLIKFNYRLRKELMAKGYSDGGVGGARICADVFTSVDGSAEENKPSWKETRRTVVTQADAFMSYLYAGQASQFALILKTFGKNPNAFPVEMLDNVDFGEMSYDTVNWTKEAEEAYVWASDPANQPAGKTNFSNDLKFYKLYAAVNLFRITAKEEYHTQAKAILNEMKTATQLNDDERWGVYSYLLANTMNVEKSLQSALTAVSMSTADNKFLNAVDKRACRWGGAFDMPMLVGQATTPLVLEALVAYKLSGNIKYKNAIHTTADYFLGTNPRHTSWITGVGPRPPAVGFHLDSRYNHNWVLYPGFIPYGPWSMAYGTPTHTWNMDGVSVLGGQGPWDKDWANFSQYPLMEQWPGHERWNSNIHSPMSSENTIHQNTVFGGIAYGFVNSRNNSNANSAKKIGSLALGNGDILLDVQGKDSLLTVSTDIPDASFPALKWESSDKRIAIVDNFGRISGLTSGTCTISVSTLDGSVSDSFTLTCSWPEVNVEEISISPDSLTMVEGQKKNLIISFTPADATNKFTDWTYSSEGVVSVDENGQVNTLAPGNVYAIATSLNGGKKDSCYIFVKEAVDFVLADFDLVIPVTTTPMPDYGQIYTPTGTNDTAFLNPLVNESNLSEKVVKWGRPTGDWKLIGMVLPTDYPQDLTQYAQFQFKYFGKGVKNFFIQLFMDDESSVEINEAVQGEDCWQMFSYDLSESKKLVQFNVFVNKTGNPEAITILFDDFKLAGKALERFDGMTLSETSLEMDSPTSFKLSADAAGKPFSWVSSNPAVANVDQTGMVKAVSGGTATIKAVPLFGTHAECSVVVDGGISTGIVYNVIADFEAIEVDWSGGFGVYGWSSDSIKKAENPLKQLNNNSEKTIVWKRDGTNNWAGCGLIFPITNTAGFDLLAFQVYSTEAINTIRIEIKNGDVVEGFYQLNNLGIPANEWTTVTFDLADLTVSNKQINTINFQIAGGSDTKMLAYIDNILLRTVGIVDVTGVSINETGPISKTTVDLPFQLSANVLPADATDKSINWSSSNIAVATVSATGLVTIKGKGSATITVTSVENSSLKASVAVNVTFPVGLDSKQVSNIRIYPNPFNNLIQVTNLSNIQAAELTNILGKVVKQIDCRDKSSITFDTKDLPAGIYHISFYFDYGNRETKRIIKK